MGVDHWNIPLELNNLIEDAKAWVKNEVFTPDEFAIRFKHRIVSIHCFSNGNGRHSRLMADIISEKVFDIDPFTWGDGDSNNMSDTRSEYLKALKDADNGSLDRLLKFARS